MTAFDYGDDGNPPLYIHPACLQDHDPYGIARNVKETFVRLLYLQTLLYS